MRHIARTQGGLYVPNYVKSPEPKSPEPKNTVVPDEGIHPDIKELLMTLFNSESLEEITDEQFDALNIFLGQIMDYTIKMYISCFRQSVIMDMLNEKYGIDLRKREKYKPGCNLLTLLETNDEMHKVGDIATILQADPEQRAIEEIIASIALALPIFGRDAEKEEGETHSTAEQES